jgi:hypothetical protein
MNVSFRPHPSRLFFGTARNLIPAVDLCQRFSKKEYFTGKREKLRGLHVLFSWQEGMCQVPAGGR